MPPLIVSVPTKPITVSYSLKVMLSAPWPPVKMPWKWVLASMLKPSDCLLKSRLVFWPPFKTIFWIFLNCSSLALFKSVLVAFTVKVFDPAPPSMVSVLVKTVKASSPALPIMLVATVLLARIVKTSVCLLKSISVGLTALLASIICTPDSWASLALLRSIEVPFRISVLFP